MTKKHFQSLADALKHNKPDGDMPQHMDQWRQDVEAIGRVCKEYNPHFDYGRFLEACSY